MYVIDLVGDNPDVLREKLVEELKVRGRVGTLEAEADTIDPGLDRAITVGENGGWNAVGTDGDVTSLLDRLAPDCDYAVVIGAQTRPGVTLEVTDGTVSGGVISEATRVDAVDIPRLVDRVEEREQHETLASLVDRVKRSEHTDRAGAIATFTGRVRTKDTPDDTPTEYLEFERYGDVADRRLKRIREELLERDRVYEVLLHHRTGVIGPGEDIVFVVVLAGHREEAFATVEDGINRLKDEVPIFKKEVTVDEEFWVHSRP